MRNRIVILFLFLGTLLTAMGQTVPRSFVVMEVGTGTWCYYCPGAAMGADDLVEGGALVAVIENHNGDPFANASSNARNSFYNITGYPTAVFDGVTSVVGGSHTASMASSYVPKYQQRIAIPSNISMSMAATNSGLDYTVVVTMTKVGNLTATNLKLRFAVTVSNITYAWQGQTHLNFVNALMVPDAGGTAVDFSSGSVQTATLTFQIDPTWPVEDIEFVAFVQSDANKEIQQGIKLAAVDLNVDFAASATQVPKNQQVTFTNNTTGGFMHAPEIYHWDFPGAVPDTSNEENPVVTYTECGPHNVKLTVNRGGQIKMMEKTTYIQVGPVVNVAAIPNDTSCWNVPITLDATTPNATYLWTPGGATTPTLTVAYPEYGYGSHTFTVTVSTPDGCQTTKNITIYIDACTGINPPSGEPLLTLFPNPGNGRFTVEYVTPLTTIDEIRVVDILGNVLFRETGVNCSGKLIRTIDLNNPAPGIYFLNISGDKSSVTRKIFVR